MPGLLRSNSLWLASPGGSGLSLRAQFSDRSIGLDKADGPPYIGTPKGTPRSPVGRYASVSASTFGYTRSVFW